MERSRVGGHFFVTCLVCLLSVKELASLSNDLLFRAFIGRFSKSLSLISGFCKTSIRLPL